MNIEYARVSITQDQFLAYENVRVSGVTNMWDVDLVIKLSGNKFTEREALYIMRHYGELKKKYI